MSGLCLLAVGGALLWQSPGPTLTLRWTHSVAKTQWEEDWRADGAEMVLDTARIEGSGAGMEPPPEAVRAGRFWHWRPGLRLRALTLAQLDGDPVTGAAGVWRLCVQDHCVSPPITGSARLVSCAGPQ